jgi:hypothetical protein
MFAGLASADNKVADHLDAMVPAAIGSMLSKEAF